MSIQGLGARLPLSTSALQVTPGDLWHPPCVPSSTMASFQPLSDPLVLLQPKTDTSPHLSLFDTFFKSCGFFSLLINFYLYLMRHKASSPFLGTGTRHF